VFVRVTDTGIGIPREKEDAIFEPFVQVHVGMTRTTEGAGLGLAISRDLARGMGGDVRARSEEGKGSTFTVRLPKGGVTPANSYQLSAISHQPSALTTLRQTAEPLSRASPFCVYLIAKG
jgi:K+-sensing histidine kinase KdpD